MQINRYDRNPEEFNKTVTQNCIKLELINEYSIDILF